MYVNLISNAFAADGGGTDVTSVSVEGQAVSLDQVEGTVYVLRFPEPVEAGASVDLEMVYTVRIPNIENRFGWQDGIHNVGNFLITPSVWEDGGWVCAPYVDLGDAFYTDLANYRVTIHVPDGWGVAATGTNDGTGTYRAERVRDFVFCASDGFETLQAQVDDTEVLVYYRDGMSITAQRTLETAQKALTLYNERLGKYPYETLSLVLSGMTSGVLGTEYPTLVMVGPEISLETIEEEGTSEAEQNSYCRELDKTVAHEIAHQWFYGIVGNDQIRYPWLDEGLCRFAEMLYEEAYPPEEPQAEWAFPLQEYLEDTWKQLEDSGTGAGELQYDLYYWTEMEPADYGTIYYNGASLFYGIREQLGTEVFNRALRQYVDTFAWTFVTPDGFRAYWNHYGDFDAIFAIYGVQA